MSWQPRADTTHWRSSAGNIVSDLGLPDIPGDVLIRAIAAVARHSISVVVVTGESVPDSCPRRRCWRRFHEAVRVAKRRDVPRRAQLRARV